MREIAEENFILGVFCVVEDANERMQRKSDVCWMHCVEADLPEPSARERVGTKKTAQLQLRAFVTKLFDC